MILRITTTLSVLTSSLFAQGFSRTVWESDHTTMAAAPAGDWNLDGMPDLLVSDALEVHVLSGVDGTSIWTSPYFYSSAARGRGVAMANDLNSDGTADIYTFGARWVGTISGVDGSPIWTTYVGGIDSLRVVGDVNGDGADDVLIADPGVFIAPTMFGEVRMLDGASGNEIWSMQASDHTALGYATAAMGDLNNDAIPDVVLGDGHGNGRIRAVSGADGSIIWTRSNPVLTSAPMLTTTRIASINGDPVDDVVSFGSDGDLGWTWVLSGTNGDILQIDTRGPTGVIDPSPTTSDIDRDGWPDVVVNDQSGRGAVILDGRMSRNVIADLRGEPALAIRWSVGIGTTPNGFGLIAMYRPPPAGPVWFSPGDAPDFDSSLVLIEVVTGVEPNALTFREQCPASHGAIPTIGFLGRPHVGEMATVTLNDAPPSANPFLLIGSRRGPPFLDPLGGVGCNLLAQPTLAVAPTTPLPDASVAFVPTPGLVGATLYCQWAMIDLPVARPLPMSFSNGIVIEVKP